MYPELIVLTSLNNSCYYATIMIEESESMRATAELTESITETKAINRENIERYIEGCEELAVRLDTVIEKVAESGKRPVVLIPSRGAVPIFLLARRFLNELKGDASYLADRNTRYYPEGIFDFLEGNQPQNPDNLTTVDVVLFPFTADVSLENSQDEALARELRSSCTRSVMKIVRGDKYSQHDLEWYQLLISKLKVQRQDPDILNPRKIVESLNSYPASENTQIILIDTVISGRAANDITSAFQTLGHNVVPLLAVDNIKGGKFQPRRKAEIQGTLRPIWEYLPEGGIFVEFPLITEDQGSGLLGLVALNFVNFNQEEMFHNVDRNFGTGFRPQSCVWTIPPVSAREQYLGNFKTFIDTAWNCRSGSPEPCSDQQIADLKDHSKPLTATHHAPTAQEINELVPVNRAADFKETASHIVSLRLPDLTAQKWIQEFSSKIN